MSSAPPFFFCRFLHDTARRTKKFFTKWLPRFFAVPAGCFQSLRHRRIERRLRKKPVVVVAFQIVHSSIWKLDRLYRLLDASEHFEPIVIVCPSHPSSDHQLQKEYEAAKALCESNQYRYFGSRQHGAWVKISDLGAPTADVVFLQNAWELTLPRYRMKAWVNALVCYVPYFYTMNTLEQSNYGKRFHRRLWRYFVESDYHRAVARKHSVWCDDGVVKTGYPGLDRFLFPESLPDPWIEQALPNDTRARIIYAPHHTISSSDSGLAYSTFEENALGIVRLAESRRSSHLFAFKPHPLLFDKLVADPSWGREKTEAYWARWRALENARVEEGDYESLFNFSDALIHDSGSFMAEYLATSKPVLYLSKKNVGKLNPVGRALLGAHYLASSMSEIETFLDDVVVNGRDPLRPSRVKLIQDLLSDNRESASQKIFYDLQRSLGVN